jgi:hypothetical protein
MSVSLMSSMQRVTNRAACIWKGCKKGGGMYRPQADAPNGL